MFAAADSGDIVRYFLDKGTLEVIYNSDRSPFYLAVDSEYEVIYWIDYIVANDSYSLKKTYFNGSTSQVNYYPGATSSVKIAIGEDDFYVMDSTRGRIDSFDRKTVSLQHTFYLSDTPSELTVVEGESWWCGLNKKDVICAAIWEKVILFFFRFLIIMGFRMQLS